MNLIKSRFLAGFEKTAGLPSWLHESHKKIVQSKPAGQSKKGLKGMMKRRSTIVGGLCG